jgi:general secretion pathway protein C
MITDLRLLLGVRPRAQLCEHIASNSHDLHMLDTRTNEWLSRLQGNGPNLVSLGLAALIAVELARIAISLLSGPVKSPQPIMTTAPQSRQHPVVNVQSVVSAHLFGIATVDPSTQDPANAPLSSANLVLAGTIATQDPKHGIAIISDGGPSKVFSVGDNVSGASLYSVFLDHVILDRNGTLETLILPRLLPGGGKSSIRRAGPDPRTLAAVDNIRRLVQQDPGILDQVMRTVPSYDNAAGKLRGFRAYPGRNRAIFNKLGLKPGDLVTAINGQALDDPQRSQEVLNTIQSSDHVTVTIERGGQKEDISLNIAQVAGEATKDLEGDSGGGGAAAQGPQPLGTQAVGPQAQVPPGPGAAAPDAQNGPTPQNTKPAPQDD